MKTRRQEAREIRHNAADLAAERPHPRHENNGEEFLYREAGAAARPTYLASFTKGLPHDEADGLVQFAPDPKNPGQESEKDDPYATFVLGIQSGDPNDFRRTPLGPPGYAYEGRQLCPQWHSDMAKTATGHRSPGRTTQCAALRAWESAGAGHVFDLEGPDAQALSMPPAPRLDSDELCAEMAEVYLMALLRDVPFAALRCGECRLVSVDGRQGVGAPDGAEGEDGEPQEPADDAEALDGYRHRGDRLECAKLAPGVGKKSHRLVEKAICILRSLKWFDAMNRATLDPPARDRNRDLELNRQTVFRGLSPGDDLGPYISQFLLVGSPHLPEGPGDDCQCYGPQDGYIQYGSITIDQRVRLAESELDFMTTWEQWLDVQNGADLRGLETYASCSPDLSSKDPRPGFRFLLTPRDLATYVHHDALYEAYLNACILLLAYQVPFDRGIPFQLADNIDKQQGFAHFGGPHILTLVTEVATRALKAVRFQKFNVHRRARPEQVAGLLHRWMTTGHENLEPLDALRCCLGGELEEGVRDLVEQREKDRACRSPFLCETPVELPRCGDARVSLLEEIAEHNRHQNKNSDRSGDPGSQGPSYLLPMAFAEGSPMHPAYGAGHATVAGACVTVLKAYFDHGFRITDKLGGAWEADPKTQGRTLRKADCCDPLTVEGELNKLAANISIGRDWAGVHFFTDYIESIRLGEEIALGLLEEQKLTYRENFTMTVPLFSGEVVRI